MPRRQVVDILLGAFRCLRLGGGFHQFTYGIPCPVPKGILQSLDLETRRIGGIWRNLPPASVYRIVRRPALVLPQPAAEARGAVAVAR